MEVHTYEGKIGKKIETIIGDYIFTFDAFSTDENYSLRYQVPFGKEMDFLEYRRKGRRETQITIYYDDKEWLIQLDTEISFNDLSIDMVVVELKDTEPILTAEAEIIKQQIRELKTWNDVRKEFKISNYKNQSQ